MPVTYSISSNVLLITAAGEYEPHDLPRTFLAALNDPACPGHVALLLDVRPSSMLATRSMDDIRAIGQFLGPYTERIGGRCAVVTGTEVQYGLGRMGSIVHGVRRGRGRRLPRHGRRAGVAGRAEFVTRARRGVLCTALTSPPVLEPSNPP